MSKIIYEHDDFLVVNKPAGISFHNDLEQKGFFTQLQDNCADKLYSIHRLDKVTSGLLIIAKNNKAASVLATSFAEHLVKKEYLALTDRSPKKKQGRIIGDMKKSRGGNWILLRSRENPAITEFRSYFLSAFGVRLFVLSPQTGKTHQLRVMMKSIGAPILGDDRYGGSKAERCFLHAYKLDFFYRGEHFCFTDLPDWGQLIEIKESIS